MAGGHTVLYPASFLSALYTAYMLFSTAKENQEPLEYWLSVDAKLVGLRTPTTLSGYVQVSFSARDTTDTKSVIHS